MDSDNWMDEGLLLWKFLASLCQSRSWNKRNKSSCITRSEDLCFATVHVTTWSDLYSCSLGQSKCLTLLRCIYGSHGRWVLQQQISRFIRQYQCVGYFCFSLGDGSLLCRITRSSPCPSILWLIALVTAIPKHYGEVEILTFLLRSIVIVNVLVNKKRM